MSDGTGFISRKCVRSFDAFEAVKEMLLLCAHTAFKVSQLRLKLEIVV